MRFRVVHEITLSHELHALVERFVGALERPGCDDVSDALAAIKGQLDTMTPQLGNLIEKAAAIEDKADALIVVVKGLADALQAAKDDPVQIQAIADGLGQQTQEIADAILEFGPATPPAPTNPLAITTPSLGDGTVGAPYSGLVETSGGVAPITVEASGLPDGLVMGADGRITGAPTTAGGYVINVTATDSAAAPSPASATSSLGLTVT